MLICYYIYRFVVHNSFTAFMCVLYMEASYLNYIKWILLICGTLTMRPCGGVAGSGLSVSCSVRVSTVSRRRLTLILYTPSQHWHSFYIHHPQQCTVLTVLPSYGKPPAGNWYRVKPWPQKNRFLDHTLRLIRKRIIQCRCSTKYNKLTLSMFFCNIILW